MSNINDDEISKELSSIIKDDLYKFMRIKMSLAPFIEPLWHVITLDKPIKIPYFDKDFKIFLLKTPGICKIEEILKKPVLNFVVELEIMKKLSKEGIDIPVISTSCYG